jgi:hypothetical protein
MNDERLLKDLARLERARSAADPEPAWDRLAAGTASAEQVAHWQAEARESASTAAAWEAFQPLEPEFRAALVERLRCELPGADVAPERAAAAPTPSAWRRLPVWLRFALVPALVTASLLVTVRPWQAPEPLPDYALHLAGGSRNTRSVPASASPDPPTFAPGNRFELVLTPATSAGRALEARTFVLRGRQLEALDASLASVSEDGAWRLVGVVGQDLQLPSGDFALLVIVGRPGALPEPASLVGRVSASAPLRTPLWSAWLVGARGVRAP